MRRFCMPDTLSRSQPFRTLEASTPLASHSEKSLAEMLSISDWRRFAPEAIGLVGLIWLVRATVLDPSSGHGMPHPFWIAVLLMASQYGVMGGLFATSLASVVFLAAELPAQSAGQDFYAYAATGAAQPCAWFAIALIIGGLRTLHRHHETELKEELRESCTTAQDLAQGLALAAAEIERVERRIAVDANTLASFSHALARLTLANRESLVVSVGDMLEQVVGVTSFTILLDDDAGLRAVLKVEDGARVPNPAMPPDAIDGPRKSVAAVGSVRMPHWWPISPLTGGVPLGFVLCSRLGPSRDPDIASHRIADICQLLALLLPVCPELER